MRKTTLAVLFIFFSLISVSSLAKIDFSKPAQETLDIETLDIDKAGFFDFVKSTIMAKKPGLGKYDRVSFSPCDIKINDQKIIDYRDKNGKEIRFFSNPSCYQIVVRRVLENSYQYNKSIITNYQNRQCMQNVVKIISPLLEYYTIRYEERNMGNCDICDFKEKKRIELILATQQKVIQHCKSQSDNVIKFISELDSHIESTFKLKTSK